MSSTTRTLVLGCVKLFQPVHGYDVRRELMTWHAQDWANAAPGSIYSALKILVKEGALEVVGTKAIGGRPERTMFRITPRGEQELFEAVRDTWWNVKMLVDPMVAGVSMISFMERAEAIQALEARIVLIEGNVLHATLVTDAIDGRETPPHVREMMWLISARAMAEVAWARAFITRLRAGEYHLRGEKAWMHASTAAHLAAGTLPKNASKHMLRGVPAKPAKPAKKPAKPRKRRP
jgi:DNA-binding PadR family transcriptional regulator